MDHSCMKYFYRKCTVGAEKSNMRVLFPSFWELQQRNFRGLLRDDSGGSSECLCVRQMLAELGVISNCSLGEKNYSFLIRKCDCKSEAFDWSEEISHQRRINKSRYLFYGISWNPF